MTLTLLGIAAVLIVVWMYLRWRNKAGQETATATTTKTEDTTYHAVSIKFEESRVRRRQGNVGTTLPGQCRAAPAVTGVWRDGMPLPICAPQGSAHRQRPPQPLRGGGVSVVGPALSRRKRREKTGSA